MINVTDPPYGAIPDGVTPCDDAFEAAVTAAVASKQAIFIPVGDYLLVRTWALPEALHVFGESMVYTRLKFQPSAADLAALPSGGMMPAVHIDSASVLIRNARLHDFGIFGLGNSLPTVGLKLALDGTDYRQNSFHGDSLSISGFGVGLYNGKCDQSGIHRSRVADCGICIHTDGNRDFFHVDDTAIDGAAIVGVKATGGNVYWTGGVSSANRMHAHLGDGTQGKFDGIHFEGIPPDAMCYVFAEWEARAEFGLCFHQPAPGETQPFVRAQRGHINLGNFYVKASVDGNARVCGAMNQPVTYNVHATYLAKPWAVEFV